MEKSLLVCSACVHSPLPQSGNGQSLLVAEAVLIAVSDLAHGAKVPCRGC